MGGKKIFEWFLIVSTIVLVGLGILAPIIIVVYGARISTWDLFSWEVYVTLLSIVIYIILIGILRNKIRKH